MTKIPDLLRAGRTYSFEFFPPKTSEAEEQLATALVELEPLHPSFVSVTYGAGGSTREGTRNWVLHILRDTSMLPMAHLTCAAHFRSQLEEILTGYWNEGVENILALRGDPPKDADLPKGDLGYASDLVNLVRECGDFSVGVAVHPEGHPASTIREDDLYYHALKLKLADFGITQFFFHKEDYLRFRDEMTQRGVHTAIIPGIMPVTNFKQIQRFADLSGAAFPTELAARFDAVSENPEDVRKVGVEVATRLCGDLLAAGAPGLHFYTLNRSLATREIYQNLGFSAK